MWPRMTFPAFLTNSELRSAGTIGNDLGFSDYVSVASKGDCYTKLWTVRIHLIRTTPWINPRSISGGSALKSWMKILYIQVNGAEMRRMSKTRLISRFQVINYSQALTQQYTIGWGKGDLCQTIHTTESSGGCPHFTGCFEPAGFISFSF